MNIGKQIKRLRKEKDLTQEQFAECMNVSTSAVSQWESEKTVPDISTILSIANFFDVTLDCLFDRNDIKKEKEFEEYRKLSAEYGNQGEIYKQLSLWRDAVSKYPGNCEFLINLAASLVETFYCGGEIETIEAAGKEAIVICERILRESTDDCTRQKAICLLVDAYSYRKFSFASEEKAAMYANMATGAGECKEELLEIAYFTEESAPKRLEQKHKNILNHMDMLTMKLYYGEFKSAEDKIEWSNLALNLWQTLIYDGNYLFFHCRIKKIYQSLAIAWAELKNKEETLKALQGVLYHSVCLDNMSEGEQRYTSKYVSFATENPALWGKNYTVSDKEHAILFMQWKDFDFLKNDPEYLSMIEE